MKGKNERYSAREVFQNFDDVSSPEAISFYFNKLYEIEKEERRKNDFLYAKAEGMSTDYSRQANMFNARKIYRSLEERGISYFNFAGYAKSFKLIDDFTHPVLIIDKRNRAETEALLNELRYAASGRMIRRKLQKYIVSLRHYEWEKLAEAGVIQTREGIDCLANENYYNQETGISFEDSAEYIF